MALDEVMKGRTTFVIAHRLATIRAATRILVFETAASSKAAPTTNWCRAAAILRSSRARNFRRRKPQVPAVEREKPLVET